MIGREHAGRAGSRGRRRNSGPGSPLRGPGPCDSRRRSWSLPARWPSVRISPIARCSRSSSRGESVAATALGMDPRVVQHLVRVDIADSRQHLLVHQGRLDAARRPRQPLRRARRGRSRAHPARATANACRLPRHLRTSRSCPAAACRNTRPSLAVSPRGTPGGCGRVDRARAAKSLRSSAAG